MEAEFLNFVSKKNTEALATILISSIIKISSETRKELNRELERLQKERGKQNGSII